jgi:hypothetical protein
MTQSMADAEGNADSVSVASQRAGETSEEQKACQELRERSLRLWLALAGKQAQLDCYGGYVHAELSRQRQIFPV